MNEETLKKAGKITKLMEEYGINDETMIGAMIAHMDEHKILDKFIGILPKLIENLKRDQN